MTPTSTFVRPLMRDHADRERQEEEREIAMLNAQHDRSVE